MVFRCACMLIFGVNISSLIHEVHGWLSPLFELNKIWVLFFAAVVFGKKIIRFVWNVGSRIVFFFAEDCEKYYQERRFCQNKWELIESCAIEWKFEGLYFIERQAGVKPRLLLRNVSVQVLDGCRLDFVITSGNKQKASQKFERDVSLGPRQECEFPLNVFPSVWGTDSWALYPVWCDRNGHKRVYTPAFIRMHPVPDFCYWKQVAGKVVNIRPFYDIADDVRITIRAYLLFGGRRPVFFLPYRVKREKYIVIRSWFVVNVFEPILCSKYFVYSVAWMLLLLRMRKIQ